MFLRTALLLAAIALAPIASATASDLLSEALAARERLAPDAPVLRYLVTIDYALPSSERRLVVHDLEEDRSDAFLVAHGKGSDPDHDGLADRFSNTHGSKMTSLGAFLTGETYYGRHGLSLRLHGLETRNDEALARAIVIHGADYVRPGRAVLGRSWGCPALERQAVEHLIPLLKGGVFIYAAGPRDG